jgi:hypothetical protein
MRKRKNQYSKPKKTLDSISAESPRGRPGAHASEIAGRAENYRAVFWDSRLDEKIHMYVPYKPSKWAIRLLAARGAAGVKRALNLGPPYAQQQFEALIDLTLQVLREPAFPKRQKAQLDFLADSLAARGEVTPRRSRDICGEQRAMKRARSPHKIVRYEYYIECEYGYKGPARDNACRRCGAQISHLADALIGPELP